MLLHQVDALLNKIQTLAGNCRKTGDAWADNSQWALFYEPTVYLFTTYNPSYDIPVGAPGSVVGLSAVAPDGSLTMLNVTWSAPAQPSGTVAQYFVIVTNYSLAFVTSKTVPGDTTSTSVTGLGKSSSGRKVFPTV